MNKLSTAKRIQVVSALVEGNSLRATARMTGVARMTIEKLLRDLGRACAEYQAGTLVNLNCRRIQCDEIWAFCYAKKKNVTEKIERAHPDAGDVWTWTAIDADSKLVMSWLLGGRDVGAALAFMTDVASRIKGRVQLTTDANRAYLNVVDEAFGSEVDYAIIQNSTATPTMRSGTAPQSASDAIPRSSTATPTRTTSRPATSSART